MRHVLCITILLPVLVRDGGTVQACTPPTTWSVAAAFDLAANGLLPADYPQFPASSGVRSIPSTVLKAVGWLESGWRQFAAGGRPLVSGDFGYGIMQITSGMAGAFHDVHGTIDDAAQDRIAAEYTYNIAEGAQVLASDFAATPRIGDGRSPVLEHWYYALWAYNGWGWVNNPNNPRFTRHGTPATNPSGFPYQERVLYLVAHPPHDTSGNPLWRPVHVSLPARELIGAKPGPLPEPKRVHMQTVLPLDAVAQSVPLHAVPPGGSQMVALTLTNTGSEAWMAGASNSVSVGYDLFLQNGDAWNPASPFVKGIVAYGQGMVPLQHTVLPGGSITARVLVRAPSHSGTFRVTWDLLEGVDGWFSKGGSLPRTDVLRVLPRGAAAGTMPRARATPTARAAEGLQFVADTSIPDGSAVGKGQLFDKGWLVFNNARTAWESGWSLRLRSGPPFGGRTIRVPKTPPCHIANIVAHLRAPTRSGMYRSVWQLRDARGHAVGEKLVLMVRVRNTAASGVPTPTPRPTRAAQAATPTATPVG